MIFAKFVVLQNNIEANDFLKGYSKTETSTDFDEI